MDLCDPGESRARADIGCEPKYVRFFSGADGAAETYDDDRDDPSRLGPLTDVTAARWGLAGARRVRTRTDSVGSRAPGCEPQPVRFSRRLGGGPPGPWALGRRCEP
jgi:hypothetical protein